MIRKPNETTRLALRHLRYSDAEAIEKYASDKDVADMTARIPHPYPKGEALAFLKKSIPNHQQGDGLIHAIILEGHEDALIGVIGIENITGCEPEIGYWLGKPFWGRGLMTQALKVVVEKAFVQHSVGTLYARTYQQNKASKNVLLKCGFVETGEGTCNSPARKEKIVAANIFELRHESWAAQQERVT